MITAKKLLSFVSAISALAFLMVSCEPSDNIQPTDETIANMLVSPDFRFSTHETASFKVTALDNTGAPVSGVRIGIYSDLPDSSGQLMIEGLTNEQGIFEQTSQIPAGTDSLAVVTNAIGFVNAQKVEVVDGKLTCVLGGPQNSMLRSTTGVTVLNATTAMYASTVIKAISTYDNNGVPTKLVTPNDVVDAAMLNDIGATLPEGMALTISHPQYFAANAESNLVLKEACNVWVTFVHEGAGYRNMLGYYKYKTGNPPTKLSSIDSIHVIFPNVSYVGSGGGLRSGNKMYLGTFTAGTEIGWVVIADGWNGYRMTTGNGIYFSDKVLNPEWTNKQHSILCNDLGRGKFLLGFEDQYRDQGGSDNDFNDAIFYVTADPIRAVDVTNIPSTTPTKVDTDKDGVADESDAYPADASKAFNNYYPSQDEFGSLAFEDLWPAQGDYDFNDMVVDYRMNEVTNAQNQVVQIIADLKVRAIGASYHNGFGFQLPLNVAQISNVTGLNLNHSYIQLNPNKTEAGQSKATIIAFDDVFDVLPWTGGSIGGVNTTIGAPYVTPQVKTITIDLASPVSTSVLGFPPYNAFMIVNGNRQKEVHLIDNAPTDLADKSILGTLDDDSRPESGRYYVSSQNLPFAINIATSFDYPVEKAEITKALLQFFKWGMSGGIDYKDWYENKAGYRDARYIYTH